MLKGPCAKDFFIVAPSLRPAPAKAPIPLKASEAANVEAFNSSPFKVALEKLSATLLKDADSAPKPATAKVDITVFRAPKTKAPTAPTNMSLFPKFLSKNSAKGFKLFATIEPACIAKSEKFAARVENTS